MRRDGREAWTSSDRGGAGIIGALIASLVGVLGGAGCAPQTKSDGKTTVTVANRAAVGDGGGEVGLDGGTKVVVPPGALAAGSQVLIETAPTPDEFAAVGVDAASQPVAITATGPDGLPVDQVATPFTINLQIDAGAGLQLTTGSHDDLCVFLKTRGAALYVWRRAAMTVDEGSGVAQVASLFLGTFQLAYCGGRPLPGFADSTTQSAAGTGSATVMSVKAGTLGELGYGKLCLFAVHSAEDACSNGANCASDDRVLAVAEAAGGGNVELKLNLAGVAIADDGDKSKHFVAVILTGAAEVCPFAVGEKLDDLKALGGVKALFAFKVAAVALRAGLTGVLGEPGPFALGTKRVSVGAPNVAFAAQPQPETPVCLGVDTDQVGMSFVSTTFAATAGGGRVGGKDGYDMPIAIGDSVSAAAATTRVEARVGQACTSLGPLKPNPTTGLPFVTTVDKSASAATAYFAPVTMHLTNSKPAIFTGNGCLHIYPVGTVGSTATASLPTQEDIGRVTIALTQPEYKIYLPFLVDPARQVGGLPSYDMVIDLVGAGVCDAKPLQSIPLRNKVLSATIEVQL